MKKNLLKFSFILPMIGETILDYFVTDPLIGIAINIIAIILMLFLAIKFK